MHSTQYNSNIDFRSEMYEILLSRGNDALVSLEKLNDKEKKIVLVSLKSLINDQPFSKLNFKTKNTKLIIEKLKENISNPVTKYSNLFHKIISKIVLETKSHQIIDLINKISNINTNNENLSKNIDKNENLIKDCKEDLRLLEWEYNFYSELFKINSRIFIGLDTTMTYSNDTKLPSEEIDKIIEEKEKFVSKSENFNIINSRLNKCLESAKNIALENKEIFEKLNIGKSDKKNKKIFFDKTTTKKFSNYKNSINESIEIVALNINNLENENNKIKNKMKNNEIEMINQSRKFNIKKA